HVLPDRRARRQGGMARTGPGGAARRLWQFPLPGLGRRRARRPVARSRTPLPPAVPVSQPAVQAQLSVRDGRAAIAFYKAAFGAVELYRFGGSDDVVAQLAVGEAAFWVEDESPPH